MEMILKSKFLLKSHYFNLRVEQYTAGLIFRTGHLLCSHQNVVLWNCLAFPTGVSSEIMETSEESPTCFLH